MTSSTFITDHIERGSLIYSLCSLTSLIIIRVYTKRWVNKFGMDWSDWTLLLAFVIELSYCALGMRGAYYGGGTHQWNLTAERAIKIAKIANTAEILYNPAAFFTKLSITLQVLRIFGGLHRGTVFWICHITIWFNLLFQTAMMFVAIFHCQPQQKYWMPWIPGECMSPNAPLLISAIISTFTDLILFIVPIACVWRLQMSKRQKWGVSAVFATAFFAVICSIMRIVSTVTFIHAGMNDATWGFTDLALWTFGEVGGGIVSSCMAVLPQFFRHIYPKLRPFWDRASTGRTIKGSSRDNARSPAPRGFMSAFSWSRASTKVPSADSDPSGWTQKEMSAADWTGRKQPMNPLSSNPLTEGISRASSPEPPPVPPKDSWYIHSSSESSLVEMKGITANKEASSIV